MKEKINNFLGPNEKDNVEASNNKSDDDTSVREIIDKDVGKDDHSSSLGTLSEQDSIKSETETDDVVLDIENNNDINRYH